VEGLSSFLDELFQCFETNTGSVWFNCQSYGGMSSLKFVLALYNCKPANGGTFEYLVSECAAVLNKPLSMCAELMQIVTFHIFCYLLWS
jgi:hypothetical protein